MKIVGSSLSISALLLRLSVLGLMSNLPALLSATFIARNPITDKFFDEFRRLLEQLVTYRCPLVIVGDLNVHLEKADCTHTKRFNRLLKSFGLFQHVADPTHNQGGFWMFLLLEMIYPTLICLCMPRLSRITP